MSTKRIKLIPSVDPSITIPKGAEGETVEESAKRYSEAFQRFLEECFTEATKGAVKFGLTETEEEAIPLVDKFVSNCGKRMIDFITITQIYADKHAQLFFAKWVFTNYDTWQGIVDYIGETEAILSGLFTFVVFEGEEAFDFGSKTNEAGILDRWGGKVKPLQREIRLLERKQKKLEASLVDTKRQEAGLFAVNRCNEILAKFFPTNGERGRVRFPIKNGFGECYLKLGLAPMDMSVFASLVSSLVKNTAKDKFGEEFYYISQKSFCRAFFNLDKEGRGVSDSELKVIEESVDRLANARFMNINISKGDTSMKLAFEYDQGEAEELDEPSILAHPRYLPIYEYERDLPNLVNKIPSWVIKKADFERSPILDLAKEINRFYTPFFKLIPTGIRKTPSFTKAIYSILNDYILRWHEGQKAGAEIDLNKYEPIVEEGEALTRQAKSSQKMYLKKAIISTLIHLEEKEKVCTFAVGKKTKAGSIRYSKTTLSTYEGDREKIQYLKLTKVDSSQWKKVDLEKTTETTNAETTEGENFA